MKSKISNTKDYLKKLLESILSLSLDNESSDSGVHLQSGKVI